MSSRTPGSIPAGGLQIVTGGASDIIVSRGPIDAQTSLRMATKIYTPPMFDNSVGWPSADIEDLAQPGRHAGSMPAACWSYICARYLPPAFMAQMSQCHHRQRWTDL